MKLQIESWTENNLSDNACDIMKEAIICYKTGVYRPAYLMSYLAFKSTIRERLLGASKPDTISEKDWNDIQDNLKNDDIWEECVNTIIQASKINGKPIGTIFKFTNYERIKNRYEYWKNIRNSCAHAKDEHITSATVEQFWNYMQDDLSEYYVLGGKKYLLDKLCYTYKYYITIGEGELDKVLNEIAVVYRKNTIDCFNDFQTINIYCLLMNEIGKKFWGQIINYNNEYITDAFIDFLYNNKDNFVNVFEEYPKVFDMMLARHRVFIQEYLSRLLESGYYLSDDENIFWKLVVKVLADNPKEIDTNKICNNYSRFRLISRMNLNSIEIEILHKNRIFKQFLLGAGADYFSTNGDSQWKYYEYGSGKNDEDVEECFKIVEFDEEIISKLDSAYGYLKESISSRSRSESIANGNRRKKSYDKVISDNSSKILTAISASTKVLNDFPFVEKSLKEQNIIQFSVEKE